jgi:tetratricopeptide (TPR) repeat protein
MFSTVEIQLNRLPLATQMLLDPQLELDAGLLEEWNAACRACSADAAMDRSEVLQPSPAISRINITAGARRRPRQLVDAHDFFALSDALDTLTGELKASTAHGAPVAKRSSPSLQHTATPTQLGVGDFDTRRDALQSETQQAAVREAAVAFHNAQYITALEHLHRACSLCMAHKLTPSLLHNIAVCYFKLEQWDLCASVTERVLSIDTAHLYPSQQRLARVYICLGNMEGAQRLVAEHRDAVQWRDEAAAVRAFSAYHNHYAAHQYGRARESLEALLALLPCGTLEAAMARLLSLDNAGAAAQYARQKALLYPCSTEAHLAAWELAFHAATTEADLAALHTEMQRASAATSELRFRLLLSHVARCRDAVNKLAGLAKTQRWSDVVASTTQILSEPFVSDGVKGILFHDRARAQVQLGTCWYEALDDAHRALSYAETRELRAQLLLLVARCEEALGRWQDAIDHAGESVRLQRSPSAEAYVQSLKERRARKQKKSSPHRTSSQGPSSSASSPPNRDAHQQRQQRQGQGQPSPHSSLDVHYETLALRGEASAAEVRKAYRAMAMKWHPDRWCGATDDDIRVAESRFKSIQDAYEQLMQSLT